MWITFDTENPKKSLSGNVITLMGYLLFIIASMDDAEAAAELENDVQNSAGTREPREFLIWTKFPFMQDFMPIHFFYLKWQPANSYHN